MTNAWMELMSAGVAAKLKTTSFDGNAPKDIAEVAACADGGYTLVNGAARWQCNLRLEPGKDGAIDGLASFKLESGGEPCGNVAVSLAIQNWSAGNYVLMPAAAYDGNRFRVVPVHYPPFIHEEDGVGATMPVTITDVPHLRQGSGHSQIHLRSGDMSTPCIGFQSPSRQKGFLLLFEHVTAFGYTGVKLIESEDRAAAAIELEAPAVRQSKYTMADSHSPSDDAGASFLSGDTVTLRFRIVLFDCVDVPALFDAFFEHRKDMCGSYDMAHGLPLSAAYGIIEKKFNESQFNEEFGYYMLSAGGQGSAFGDWQAGWCGGGMSSLALLYDGSPLSRERANRTMDAVFGALQNENGFILPIFSGGVPLGDDFCHQDRAGVLLIRKDADVLAFASRHILLLRRRGEPVPQRWLKGLAMLADVFARLWERHGQFGQFVDIGTEEILIGGTASGSMAPGGLALASAVLGEDRYLRVACQSAEYYYENYVAKGLLNGGPGEILQNADSESASNMLESFMILYDTTANMEWLPMAEDAARICASWCVSYDFAFPAGSAFGQLGMRTLGSVYANVQNKHSAPGFCTVSGASLLRLFRATGDRRYLELCRETAHNVTQYLSREDRPIASWHDGRPLPAGWMCERVNMCDWEGKENIGNVFCGGCWCEVSCLLSYAEIPGIWLFTDTGEAVVIDHVDVTVSDAGDCWQLLVRNPTAFDAEIKLLCERRQDFNIPWDQCETDGLQTVSVAAGGCAVVKAGKAASKQPLPRCPGKPDLQYNPQ